LNIEHFFVFLCERRTNKLVIKPMEFEWDEFKNIQNIEKHGISFDDAIELFKSVRLSKEDNRIDYGETRWITIGLIKDFPVVTVYTLRQEKIRLISVRLANKKEKQVYYEAIN